MWPFKKKRQPTERQQVIIEHADKIEAWVTAIEHATPCRNPDCQAFRAELMEMVGHTRRQHG